MKIATHNSATGEKGKGFLSFLVAIFSKCQSKTIKEQYNAGCRYFDIRVKLIRNKWVCAHGLWKTKRSALEILNEINYFQDPSYVMLTYEGKKNKDFKAFTSMVEHRFKNIKYTSINIKKPVWTNIKDINLVPCKNAFKNLDGSSWHTYLPLPWLWKKIYYNKPKFNEEYFIRVDFL